MEFGTVELADLYDEVSHPDGISPQRLREITAPLVERTISGDNLDGFRRGARPWKRLKEEILPVRDLISAQYSDAVSVRFPLDSSFPDAWLRFENGRQLGVEVTGALVRSDVEVGKELMSGVPVAALIGLPDEAPQRDFTMARQKGRMWHSAIHVDSVLINGVKKALADKDDEKYAGFALLVVAPLRRRPRRSDVEWREILLQSAEMLPFAEIYLMERSGAPRTIRVK
ncbi:hypothetical protein [Rhizobium indigoferae]|uniref:Uncharacterized protein n=1 Tax=Rhizobium indigoferae TaxID=158891 RepID=A0ABZ0ZDJ2_9HYPH|nr:hypothetical protein [Rhizobium indigoferae]NNU56180.1 hypothetical protein [Rhizobium indigoferae]WQN37701.1 hypothetical protein U5G49_002836 [Rhizobium indigoferae]GLR59290.1 hypothetical protein GCM10007919_40170 [Rhizobium indigoferae]